MTAMTVEWERRVAGTPEQVWPYVADTERMHRMLGSKPLEVSYVKDEQGRLKRLAKSTLGGLPASWEDHPTVWREPEFYIQRRSYMTSPIKEYRLVVRLEPDGSSTRIVYRGEFTPRHPMLMPLMRVATRQFRQFFDSFTDRLEDVLAGRQTEVFVESHPAPLRDRRMERFKESLAQQGFATASIERLIQHVAEGPDYELLRIRPFELADRWERDRLEVLRLCLHSTRIGLLQMSWDLICPGCRSAGEHTDNLAALKPQAHCEACNIRFDANFDNSVELSFRPAKAIRDVPEQLFCLGGPRNTPHVVAQFELEPGKTETWRAPVEEGAYRLRGPQITGQMVLVVREDGPEEALLDLDALPAESEVRPGGTLVVANGGDQFHRTVLERTAWADTVVRASYVTSLQEFRDLFSSQVLAPGLEIGVARLAFLFTDLKASTAMYESLGDAAAFALVQDHFRILESAIARNQGAIVKTIGDAVMAVFSDVADCVKAGMQIHRDIDRFNGRSPHPTIIVKLGAHVGPCIAVNLNERLDYFGTTVNVAARVQGESEGGDLVLTEEVMSDPVVGDLLARQPLSAERLTVTLKGLSRPFHLTRLRVQAKPGTAMLVEGFLKAAPPN